LVIAIHQANHRGQLADARRAAGRQPVFTPGIYPAGNVIGIWQAGAR